MGEIIKTPRADPTCDSFFEVHQDIELAGGADTDVSFERTYGDTPVAFVTPNAENTFSVSSITPTKATITTAASSTITTDVLVIGE